MRPTANAGVASIGHALQNNTGAPPAPPGVGTTTLMVLHATAVARTYNETASTRRMRRSQIAIHVVALPARKSAHHVDLCLAPRKGAVCLAHPVRGHAVQSFVGQGPVIETSCPLEEQPTG